MATAADVASLLRRSRSVLLVAHRPPDADGVGSLLALGRLLEDRGAQVERVCAEPLDPGLLTLPGAERVALAPSPAGRWDAAVLLDCASLERAGLGEGVLSRAGRVVNVDHHLTNPGFGDLPLVDPAAPATAALVAALFDALGEEIAPEDATCLYAGLLTDTDRFTAENAGPEAHLLAARLLRAGAASGPVASAMYAARPLSALRLEARALERLRTNADGRVAWVALGPEDFRAAGVDASTAEDLAPMVAAVAGVWAGAYLRPGQGGVRVGLRSRHPAVDVAAVAQRLGGGGHRWAAGCTLPPDPDPVARVVGALEEAVRRAAG
ncbi:MAG: DHH family phosphoesterase [Firmicutes bacterium]|nr:DHH family phosphoesterase [Bacillota bacterium]